MRADKAKKWADKRQRVNEREPEVKSTKRRTTVDANLNYDELKNKKGPMGPLLPMGRKGNVYTTGTNGYPKFPPSWGRGVNPDYSGMLEGYRNRKMPASALNNFGNKSEGPYDPNFSVWAHAAGPSDWVTDNPEYVSGFGARFHDANLPQRMGEFARMKFSNMNTPQRMQSPDTYGMEHFGSARFPDYVPTMSDVFREMDMEKNALWGAGHAGGQSSLDRWRFGAKRPSMYNDWSPQMQAEWDR